VNDIGLTPPREEVNSPLPIAAVTLIASSEINYWRVVSCPYCDRTHHHGAGRPGENPADYLGTRVSHCSRDWDSTIDGRYELKWAADLGTHVSVTIRLDAT
jgi:hypothetical protein